MRSYLKFLLLALLVASFAFLGAQAWAISSPPRGPDNLSCMTMPGKASTQFGLHPHFYCLGAPDVQKDFLPPTTF